MASSGVSGIGLGTGCLTGLAVTWAHLPVFSRNLSRHNIPVRQRPAGLRPIHALIRVRLPPWTIGRCSKPCQVRDRFRDAVDDGRDRLDRPVDQHVASDAEDRPVVHCEDFVPCVEQRSLGDGAGQRSRRDVVLLFDRRVKHECRDADGGCHALGLLSRLLMPGPPLSVPARLRRHSRPAGPVRAARPPQGLPFRGPAAAPRGTGTRRHPRDRPRHPPATSAPASGCFPPWRSGSARHSGTRRFRSSRVQPS